MGDAFNAMGQAIHITPNETIIFTSIPKRIDGKGVRVRGFGFAMFGGGRLYVGCRV